MKTFSVIVVSHVDFRAHKNATELINFNGFDTWRRPHHECKFTASDDKDSYSQMTKAVEIHVRKHWYSYGLCPTTSLDIYHFVDTDNSSKRPTNKISLWKPDSCKNTFVFVTSLCEKYHQQDSILFIKYQTPSHELLYCGTWQFFDTDHVGSMLSRIFQLCGLSNTKIRLMKVVSTNEFLFVDEMNTFKKEGLDSGSLLIVQQWLEPQETKISAKYPVRLQFPPFRPHSYDDPRVNFNHVNIGVALLEQAKDGQLTDITLVSATKDGDVNQLRLPAHRNVLARVPYFRAMFDVGMKDSQTGSVEVPEWVSPSALEDFRTFVYCGCWPAHPGLTVERLIDMLRLGDFYLYEEMMDSVAREIRSNYSSLTDQNVLSLLKLLETAEFPERNSLENFLLVYVENNFSRIGKTVEFNEAFGSRWFISLIDRLASHNCLT